MMMYWWLLRSGIRIFYPLYQNSLALNKKLARLCITTEEHLHSVHILDLNLDLKFPNCVAVAAVVTKVYPVLRCCCGESSLKEATYWNYSIHPVKYMCHCLVVVEKWFIFELEVRNVWSKSASCLSEKLVFSIYNIYLSQRWNKHYCVIRDDKLFYAEEDEEQEEDIRKVKEIFIGPTVKCAVFDDVYGHKDAYVHVWLSIWSRVVVSKHGC